MGITRVFQRYLSAIPKELTPEIKIMLELFRDLAQKDGVNNVIEHTEDSDISDDLISCRRSTLMVSGVTMMIR